MSWSTPSTRGQRARAGGAQLFELALQCGALGHPVALRVRVLERGHETDESGRTAPAPGQQAWLQFEAWSAVPVADAALRNGRFPPVSWSTSVRRPRVPRVPSSTMHASQRCVWRTGSKRCSREILISRRFPSWLRKSVRSALRLRSPQGWANGLASRAKLQSRDLIIFDLVSRARWLISSTWPRACGCPWSLQRASNQDFLDDAHGLLTLSSPLLSCICTGSRASRADRANPERPI